MGRKWHSFSNCHVALIAFFLFLSLVREDVFSVRVSSELGRWPWDRAGFRVQAFCQRKRKGADSLDSTCYYSYFAVKMCVRYLALKEV